MKERKVRLHFLDNYKTLILSDITLFFFHKQR